MTVRIRDQDFMPPSVINLMDCFSSDRYMHSVAEQVTILQVCQDPNNPALAIIDFSLVGAFLFTPLCQILSVDGDDSYTRNGVIAPLAIGHYRNIDVPIDTHCSTISGSLVFDFGKVIPNFMACRNITFRLTMMGEIPQSYGLSFPTQAPIAVYSWDKGSLPSPIGLSYVDGNLQVIFEYNGDTNCSCQMQCLTQSGSNQDIVFCPGQRQSFIIEQVLSGDPFAFAIQLRDGIGNSSTLNGQTLLYTDVMPPIVGYTRTDPHIKISIPVLALNGQSLEDVEYQILKYYNTVSSYQIWKDWSERPSSVFVDYDVLPGQVYGYAVRYRGRFNDVSNISSWTTVVT